MAKHCTHCGQELPKDDAQFCTRCGMLVDHSPTASEKGRLEKPFSSPPLVREGHSLREQIAQQPVSKPSSLPPEHPGWMDGLGRDRSPSLSSPESSPPLPQTPRTVPPPHELRIKVWDQQDNSRTQYSAEPSTPAFEEEGLTDPPNPLLDPVDIEDLSTHILSASGQPPLSEAEPQKGRSPHLESENLYNEELPSNSSPLTPAQRDVLGDRSSGGSLSSSSRNSIDEIARLDTEMMPARVVNKPVSLPGFQNPPVLASPLPLQSSASPASFSGFQSQVSTPRVQKQSRKPLLITLLVGLCLLLVVGGVWTYIARPFSIAPVTQPWQEFRSTDLNIAMQYPTGWSVSVPIKGSVSLHDSSNTAMFNIFAGANSSDPTHAIQQQVNKLNVTGVKALDPLPFAGLLWQRQQGNVQMNGATYGITLLAATHGKSLYMLEQIAAQSVFTNYEQTIFSPMRASIHLL